MYLLYPPQMIPRSVLPLHHAEASCRFTTQKHLAGSSRGPSCRSITFKFYNFTTTVQPNLNIIQARVKRGDLTTSPMWIRSARRFSKTLLRDGPARRSLVFNASYFRYVVLILVIINIVNIKEARVIF
jgi:hypothetical protein